MESLPNPINNSSINPIKNAIIKKLIYPFILMTILITKINSQDDFDMHNIHNNYQNRFQDDNIHQEEYIHGDMPNQRMGGAHPGFRNMEYDGHMGGMNQRRHHNHHPGMGDGMNGNFHRNGGRGQNNFGGMRSNNFHNNQQQQIIGNQNNNSGHGPFGLFNNWFANSLYEIMMMVFLVGFLFNCFCGKNANDKHALAWYNANKQYFEERYSELGIKKDDELEEENNDSLPIIKDSPYLYKFYAAGYRYIKWLLVVLEFRKRQDTISLFTSFLFPARDRIIYEVGIEPVDENASWIFCVCNKRDVNSLKKEHQDIDFFCNTFEPSVMSDGLILLSESDELYCELFQNKNLFTYYKQIEQFIDLIYYTDQQTFCKDKNALFFSFEIDLDKSKGNETTLLIITHFVNLFCDTLAQLKFSKKHVETFNKNRVNFERAKMEVEKRKEIEKKEREQYIEDWIQRNKMKGKKKKVNQKNINKQDFKHLK